MGEKLIAFPAQNVKNGKVDAMTAVALYDLERILWKARKECDMNE